mgnify:FL=1
MAIAESTCKKCGRGKYQDQEGQDSEDDCKECPKGRFGLKLGLVLKRNDGTAMELSKKEETWCMGCGAGKYLDEKGMTEASNCKVCL